MLQEAPRLSKFKLTKPSRSGNLLKPEAAADAVDWANQPIRRQNRDGDRVYLATGPIGDRGDYETEKRVLETPPNTRNEL